MMESMHIKEKGTNRQPEGCLFCCEKYILEGKGLAQYVKNYDITCFIVKKVILYIVKISYKMILSRFGGGLSL